MMKLTVIRIIFIITTMRIIRIAQSPNGSPLKG